MCKELKLVIEVDGISHTWDVTIAKDKLKDEKLTEAGFQILRFTDDEVLEKMDNVIERIDSKIEEIERTTNVLPEKRRMSKGIPPPTPPMGDISQNDEPTTLFNPLCIETNATIFTTSLTPATSFPAEKDLP
jgi:hypothetical protein